MWIPLLLFRRVVHFSSHSCIIKRTKRESSTRPRQRRPHSKILGVVLCTEDLAVRSYSNMLRKFDDEETEEVAQCAQGSLETCLPVVA
jgi:hypothetical protein